MIEYKEQNKIKIVNSENSLSASRVGEDGGIGYTYLDIPSNETIEIFAKDSKGNLTALSSFTASSLSGKNCVAQIRVRVRSDADPISEPVKEVILELK